MTYYEFLWRWRSYVNQYYFDCASDYLKCADCIFDSDRCILGKLYAQNRYFLAFNNVLKLAQGLRKAGLLK